MRWLILCPTLLGVLLTSWAAVGPGRPAGAQPRPLPAPDRTGRLTLEHVLGHRRSEREFADTPVSLPQISQLCWAGQGITDKEHGYRTSPSAGALYPIELYLVTARGVNHYLPVHHALETCRTGDVRPALRQAALDQRPVGEAPLCVVIAAVPARSARKYGSRALRYCYMEAGHVAQNILLQAAALDLAAVPIGAFDNDRAAQTLDLPKGHEVLYLLPIGPRR